MKSIEIMFRSAINSETHRHQSSRFIHDCGMCSFLGRTKDYDLYYCAKSIPTVIARYGDNGQDYTSGMNSSLPELIEAKEIAYARGFSTTIEEQI